MATTVWVLVQARREIERTHRQVEIGRMLHALRDEGRVPTSWFHRESALFDAFGPPGSGVRVYYGRHAGQFVILGATSKKSGRGKLALDFRMTLERGMRQWRDAYPTGRQP